MSFFADARAALVLAGPDAVLYGRSAAFVHQLELDEPDVIDVLLPWTSPPLDHPIMRVRRTRGTGRRPPVPQPLPHTDIVDTVLDLGDRSDAETCVFWLTEATRRGLVTMDEVLEGLDGRRRHRHRALLLDIAGDVASGATSNLEVRYVRHVERPHALPRAERQFIVPETGHRADFAYPFARLLIEVDGLAFHRGERAVRDAEIDAAHAAAGWTTVRWTWGPVVGAPCMVAAGIAGRLRAAGVAVALRPCPLEQT